MDDADLLRNRATRLFGLAARSRQEGYSEYAEELDSLAREVVRHAVAIERRRVAAALSLKSPRKKTTRSRSTGLQVVASA